MANIGITSDYAGNGTTTGVLRRYYDPKLIATAKDNLQLAKLAQKKQLPKNMGTDGTVAFFRRKATTLTTGGVVNDSTTGNAAVSTLTDGTVITARRDAADYERVNVTLAQYGSVAEISDRCSWQMLFNLLKDTITLFGEEAALFLDRKLADALIAGVLSGNKVYAGGATSTTTLQALSQSAGKLTMAEILTAVTKIKALRGSMIDGYAYAVTPVQCTVDIQQDADWIDAMNYSDPKNRIKGELGSYGSVKFVETTNPYVEDGADNAEGTFDSSGVAANDIYSTFVIGRDAFGCVELSGQGPYAPSTVVLNSADKSDPLNQKILAGWKAFWAAVVLNNNWYSIIRSKATF